MTKKSEDTPFSKFFKEESQEFFQKSEEGEELTFNEGIDYPMLPEVKPAEETLMKKEWSVLRKFFTSSQGGNLPEEVIPLHLHPSLFSRNTLFNYPALIYGNANGSDQSSKSGCISLKTLLSKQVDDLYPEHNQGNMIKKILPGIVNEAGILIEANGVSNFENVLGNAIGLLKDKMQLRGSDEELFDTQFSELKSKINIEGALIPYSTDVTFKILEATLVRISKQGKQRLEKRIKKILAPLNDIIEVEIENNPESTDPQHLKSSIGFADHYLDFEKLSSVIPESSSEHISKERLKRINGVIEILKGYSSASHKSATIIYDNGLINNDSIKDVFSNSNLIGAPLDEVCSKALTAYRNYILEFIELVKALRIGELEIRNKYVEEVHEDFFNSFDWNYFSPEEMSYFPRVILIASSNDLASSQLGEFSGLLRSNFPIKVMALQKIWTNEDEVSTDPLSFAISHRNTFVFQSSPLNPESLFNSFEQSLTSISPSYCNIEISETGNDIESLIELWTSVESRYFPQFIYNGKTGTAWGSRFDISENPMVQSDWPVYEYRIKDFDGKDLRLEIPFTSADFLSINETSKREFRIVEPEFWNDELIHLSDYLKLDEDELLRKIPYIWMTDAKNTVMKAAVSWKIVMKSTERLEYWHYLQDMGGANNYHVQKALKLQEEKIRKETDEEIANLKEEHLSMLEQVKKESTEQAMDHLTSALLDLDTDAVINPVKKEPLPQVDKPEVESDPEPSKSADEKAVAIEAEEEIISEEPWIETPLCTNCNECTDINNRMFNYNANKLAFIADPTAGTYAQLVEAAEKCPVSIIHPGKPLNPKEPDLEELMERAKKFN